MPNLSSYERTRIAEQSFVGVSPEWLNEVGGSHGWRLHARVLMGNHFHLLLETPEANLVSGMRFLLRKNVTMRGLTQMAFYKWH